MMKKWSLIAVALALAGITVLVSRVSSDATGQNEQVATAGDISAVPSTDKSTSRFSGFVKPSDDELRQKLSDIQYYVTQEDGTERPFKNEYWDNKRAGIYVDIISGEPLFSSTDKYKSGTGWPSFTRPITNDAMETREDRKLFITRTELRSRYADSHLGHVFEDGPAPTGLRYCINSAALRFIPKEDLKQEGYGQFLSLFEK